MKTYRIPVKHTADDGYETHPEAVIEVQAESEQQARVLVEGLIIAGGDAADWEHGTAEEVRQGDWSVSSAALGEVGLSHPDFESELVIRGDDASEVAEHVLAVLNGLPAPAKPVQAGAR